MFEPDPAPESMLAEHSEYIVRQLRRLASFTQEATTIVSGNTGDIEILKQHPPRVDNPHQTSWSNLLGRPSCVVNWRKEWDQQQSAPYDACDMVRDGRWTMIANKLTTEKPAPQPTGYPRWVSDIPGTPTWALQSATASRLIVGQRYTWNADRYVRAVRFDRAVASPAIDHELWLVTDPLGAPNSQKIVGPIIPADTGWLTFPQGQIFMLAGQALDIFLLTRALALPTSWSGTWGYKRQNGDPSEKEINHQSAGGGREMRIHHIDNDEIDRSLQLEALAPGDEFSGGGITWEIHTVDHQLDHVRFEVDPASRATEGLYAFQFTSYAPQPISYNRADNHFLAEAQVQGFYSESDYASIVLDNHAYGVDIEIQEAIISRDWDLIAYSGD